ncbi:MAG: adenylosuccinate lyase [Deltaproteobacteria bacterium]|nr:adenylosuccinate lyase [Deltaproteobacteria bacterium]
MIDRYTRPAMGEIWTDGARYARWLEVEILACEAMAKRGAVPRKAVAAIRKRARIDPVRIAELEAEVKHDIIAFVTQVAETIGAEGRFLHLGLTSSDVLDTGFALQLKAAGELLVRGQERLIAALRRLALAHKKTLMIGRTHGMHAEPVTFGVKVASWHAEAVRNLDRLRAAIREVSIGTLSGAVGVFGNVAPDVEAYVLTRLGLAPEPVATQVVARDRHAAFFSTLAVLGASLERIAVEIRHLQRTEVGEAEEPFTTGQKGSSAMPHKRNPILSENVTGLARLLRGYAGAALENVALWHERDISHSSVERVIAPDATIALDFMLARMAGVLENLAVRPERMRANLDLSAGVVLSENVLLALVRKGAVRQEAYRWVQRAAHAALAGEARFAEALAAEPEIRKRLTVRELEELLDPGRHLEHIDLLFRRGLGTSGPSRRRQTRQRPAVRTSRRGAK